MTINPIEIFKECLRHPDDSTRLESVRNHSEAILNTLEVSATHDAELEQLSDQTPPHWLGLVYEALSGPAGEVPAEESVAFTALREEAAQIGEAFATTFMADPPHLMTRLQALCEGLPKIPSDEELELLKCPSLDAAGTDTYGFMASRGLTPLTILHATDALALLFKRYVSYDLLPPTFDIETASGSIILNPPALSVEQLTSEISAYAEVSDDLAEPLLPWIVETARFKPLLFEGLLVEVIETTLHVSSLPIRVDNLHLQWSRTHAGAIVYEQALRSLRTRSDRPTGHSLMCATARFHETFSEIEATVEASFSKLGADGWLDTDVVEALLDSTTWFLSHFNEMDHLGRRPSFMGACTRLRLARLTHNAESAQAWNDRKRELEAVA